MKQASKQATDRDSKQQEEEANEMAIAKSLETSQMQV